MITQLRKLVAGPKNRTITQNFDLDFTYITDTIVAMAYPATGLQQTYRNSIYDVVEYLKQKHDGHYLIINVSNRQYDYKIFNQKVKEYQWQDHQAPTLDVLFQICYDSYAFLIASKERVEKDYKHHKMQVKKQMQEQKHLGEILKVQSQQTTIGVGDKHKQQLKKQANFQEVLLYQPKVGVVCFHCNHGKGRTGTAIICMFLFTGFFKDVEGALKFYNKRRFQGEKYAVSQPCQIRYMHYFLEALCQIRGPKCRQKLKAYKLSKITFDGLNNDDYQINIDVTRAQISKYRKIPKKGNETEVMQKGQCLMSDIYISVVSKGWLGDKIIARANINLNYFVDHVDEKTVKWTMDGTKVRVSNSHSINFTIQFYFQEFCSCHVKDDETCSCQPWRKIEQDKWERIRKLQKLGRSLDSRQTCKTLFPSQVVEVEEESPYAQKAKSLKSLTEVVNLINSL